MAPELSGFSPGSTWFLLLVVFLIQVFVFMLFTWFLFKSWAEGRKPVSGEVQSLAPISLGEEED